MCLLQTGRPGRSRFDYRHMERIFPLASVSRPALEPTQPLSSGYRGPFPVGTARPGRDADHLPSTSAGSKMGRSYKLFPLRFVACMAVSGQLLHTPTWHG
jgi:hypothetical protein